MHAESFVICEQAAFRRTHIVGPLDSAQLPKRKAPPAGVSGERREAERVSRGRSPLAAGGSSSLSILNRPKEKRRPPGYPASGAKR